MKKKQILLIGGGGHCKSCIEVIESANEFDIAGIIDLKSKIGEKILGYSFIACDDDLLKLKDQYDYALITVGHIKTTNLRKRLFNMVKDIGFKIPVVISPTAYVSKHSKIGQGTVIMHKAMVNADVVIGENNIINTKALIEHDVIIADNSHISTNAILNGSVKVGSNCFFGSSTVLVNGISINDNITVGMKSLVRKSLIEEGTYVGNPLRKIK